MQKKTAVIYGGGTVMHIRPHLALSAPAYGGTARWLARQIDHTFDVDLRLTRMAGGDDIETNDDLRADLARVIADQRVGLVVMTAAVCDFMPTRVRDLAGPRDVRWAEQGVGKNRSRLSSGHGYTVEIEPADKLLGAIRKDRKDIFLVACKTTTGATEQEQFEKALDLLKRNSCNLVLANDLETRVNMVVTPEMAAYAVSTERVATLRQLVMMIVARSGLTFSRTVVLDKPDMMPWESAPAALRAVVDWLVEHGAYQPFKGVTVGHFGWMPQPGVLYSSRRKHNFNRFEDRDLVRVEFSGEPPVSYGTPDSPVAYGYKPSAGVRSQYNVLRALSEDGHEGYDCIVHFHCPMKPGAVGIQVQSQWPYECGSHECGDNTVRGMRPVAPGIQAVMLDQHGPNIVFRRDADPQAVIRFIGENFDLTKRAGAPAQAETW